MTEATTAVDQGGTASTTTTTADDADGMGWISEALGETPAGTSTQVAADPTGDVPEGDQDQEDQEDPDGEPELIELKVFGETVKATPDEVVKLAQMQLASEKKLSDLKEESKKFAAERAEFDTARQSFASFLKELANPDPLVHVAVYDHLRKVIPGIPSFQDVVSAFVERELEWHSLPETERERRQLAAERERIEAERRKIEEHQNRERSTQAERAAYEHIMTSLPAALTEAGLPQSPTVIRRIAEVWQAALAADAKLPPDRRVNPDARKVVAVVKRQLEAEKFDHLASLPEEDLLKTLPPDVVAKISRGLVKNKPKFQNRAKPQVQAQPQTGKPQYTNASEWMRKRGF